MSVYGVGGPWRWAPKHPLNSSFAKRSCKSHCPAPRREAPAYWMGIVDGFDELVGDSDQLLFGDLQQLVEPLRLPLLRSLQPRERLAITLDVLVCGEEVLEAGKVGGLVGHPVKTRKQIFGGGRDSGRLVRHCSIW